MGGGTERCLGHADHRDAELFAGPGAQPRSADTIARCQGYRALREFRARLYACLAARPDALFDVADVIFAPRLKWPLSLDLRGSATAEKGVMQPSPAPAQMSAVKHGSTLDGLPCRPCVFATE